MNALTSNYWCWRLILPIHMRSSVRTMRIVFSSACFLVMPFFAFAQTGGSAPIPTSASASGVAGATCSAPLDCSIGFFCVRGACTPQTARGFAGWACSVPNDCFQGTDEYACVSGRCVCADDTPCNNGTSGAEPSSNQQMIEQVEGHVTAPTLAVPIPGLAAFQNPTVEGSAGQRYLDIPFIAQYISAVYTYALGIIVTIATVMVVIGGVKWMLARGDSGKVSDAKETLSRAVIGVLLALGSYAILNLINPELVNLRALRIQLVEREDEQLLTTTQVTGQTESERAEEAAAAREIEAESGPRSFHNGFGVPWIARLSYQAQTYLHETLIPVAEATTRLPRQLAQAASGRRSRPPEPVGCDLTLEARYDETPPRVTRSHVEQRSQRTVELIEEVTPRVSGSRRERVQKVADTARKCVVHMGSCNATVQTINQVAGVPGLGHIAFDISGAQQDFMEEKVRECGAITDDREKARCNVRARRAVFEKLQREITNYPEVWLDTLRPGDALYIYNLNGEAAGQHSLIFMSWNENNANVIEGGRFTNGSWVRAGSLCLKGVRECRFNVYPVTKVFRPE